MFRRLLGLAALILIPYSQSMAQVKIEKVSFQGWPNCYRVGNGIIELVATADIGPRIISISFAGERNLFYVREDFAGRTGGDEWRNYGGHRLWHAPEDKVRTYQQDNLPAGVRQIDNGLELTYPLEKATGIIKTIEVTLDPGSARVRVVHRLRNTNLWEVEMAPWAISVMAPGGFAVSPLPEEFHPDRLLPNRTLALWPYTDLRDDRYLPGKDFFLLRHRAGNDAASERAKVGINNTSGWCAFAIDSYVFVKRFEYRRGAVYPDFGSSVELFTNNRMLELETLGPLLRVPAGGEVAHVETWELFKGVRLEFSEDDVRAKLLPLIKGN